MTEHLAIPESDMGFNLFCAVEETKLELMMCEDSNIPAQIEYPLGEYFEKDVGGRIEY